MAKGGSKRFTRQSVPFTSNVKDRSTSSGYQFEFICQRCGNGYRSALKPGSLGMAGKLTSGVTGLLGKRFGGIVKTGGSVLQDLAQSSAQDKAFQEAAEEVGPQFHQCPTCGRWLCGMVCWNRAAEMCVDDAPRKKHRAPEKVTACSNCGAESPQGTKFCAQCGAKLG
jgi:zinc-ribbon domain